MGDSQIDMDSLSGPLRRETVKKNVAAIHISGKLSLLQRKLSNVLLLNAYDRLGTAQMFEMDARTLCMIVGYNSNDFDTSREEDMEFAFRLLELFFYPFLEECI